MKNKQNKKSETEINKNELIEKILDKNFADPKTAPLEDCCGSQCCGCRE